MNLKKLLCIGLLFVCNVIHANAGSALIVPVGIIPIVETGSVIIGILLGIIILITMVLIDFSIIRKHATVTATQIIIISTGCNIVVALICLPIIGVMIGNLWGIKSIVSDILIPLFYCVFIALLDIAIQFFVLKALLPIQRINVLMKTLFLVSFGIITVFLFGLLHGPRIFGGW